MLLWSGSTGCNVSMTGGGGARAGAELLLMVEVVSGCQGYALVPSGHTVWFRANNVTAVRLNARRKCDFSDIPPPNSSQWLK